MSRPAYKPDAASILDCLTGDNARGAASIQALIEGAHALIRESEGFNCEKEIAFASDLLKIASDAAGALFAANDLVEVRKRYGGPEVAP